MTARLSPHFTIAELVRHSGVTVAPAHVLVNARRTASMLEAIRRQLGDVPITVTSWYRSPATNADTTGAARQSAHLNGYGVDFTVKGMTTRAVVAALAPHVRGLALDQIIDERNHVHVSADPKQRGLVLVEVVEGQYLPWHGATGTAPTARTAPAERRAAATGTRPAATERRTATTTRRTAPPMISASPEPASPGSLAWWLALIAVLIPVVLNFLGKSSTPSTP